MAETQEKEQLELKQPEENPAEGAEGAEGTEGAGESTQEETKQTSSGGLMQSGTGFGLGSYGNSAGNKIESTLSPVGNTLGKGLGAVGSPLGGVIEPLVGGVMKFGGAHGEVAGVGAGNMDKKKESEDAQMKEPLGGKDQTGENPLGL